MADEIYGCRLAFDGLILLLAATHSEHIEIETLEQWLRTFALRLNLCEKMIKRVAEDYYGHTH